MLRVLNMTRYFWRVAPGVKLIIIFQCFNWLNVFSPRLYDVPGSTLKNIYYLRTYHDANDIINTAKDKNVIIIGTSFIGKKLYFRINLKNIESIITCIILLKGMEVASSLNGTAKSISLIGRSAVPFDKILGEKIGQRLKEVSIYYCLMSNNRIKA